MLGEIEFYGSRKGFLAYPYHLIATVRLPVNSDCSIGDEIIKLINRLWGQNVSICPSRLTFPFRQKDECFYNIKYIFISKYI